MEKEKIKFEQFLSALMALYSTKIKDDELARFMGIFFSNHHISDKYDYVEDSIQYLKNIVEKNGVFYQLKDGLTSNKDISELIHWYKPCTVHEYLIIVSGKLLFNDMYLIVSKLKGEAIKANDASNDQYTKKLHNFYENIK